MFSRDWALPKCTGSGRVFLKLTKDAVRGRVNSFNWSNTLLGAVLFRSSKIVERGAVSLIWVQTSLEAAWAVTVNRLSATIEAEIRVFMIVSGLHCRRTGSTAEQHIT